MNVWEVKSTEFIENDIAWHGNKYLIGNGYLGVRGTMEEYTKEHMPAINLAGVYDQVGNAWRESVNAPNGLYAYIKVDGTVYKLPESKPVSHAQTLDFYNALHTRETVWATPKGDVKVYCERFASMSDAHLIAMKYTVTANFDGKVSIITGIDGDVWDINGPHFTELNCKNENGISSITGITGESKVTVTVSESVKCQNANEKITNEEKSIMREISFECQKGIECSIEKIISVCTSIDTEIYNADISTMDYNEEKQKHIKKWQEIWDMSAVKITGDDEAMQALNYSIYHLNCIAPRHSKSLSIPARGLSGQVYKGAIFWDTEMFMLDYYLYTEPKIARTLLRYRIDTLAGAKEKARQYNLKGAFYAWESQEGGFDACTEYNIVDVFTKRPIRTYFKDKQVHISSAIVYAMMKYIKATNDMSLLLDGGAEMILECALFYRSLLVKKADGELFEIHDVVGPDEYHERVNNNAYTNKMARFVFETAAAVVELVREASADAFNKLNSQYDLENELKTLEYYKENLYIPQPNENGVIEQFDGYFKLEDADIDTVKSRVLDPKEYWGGADGVASHTQIIKQADAVTMLSMFKHDYNSDVMKSNWEYYEPRTEHGSSLSACMYALLACYTGRPEKAYPFFIKSAVADLVKGAKQWAGLIYIGGTHPASSGGSWIVATLGFAGVDFEDGKPVCNPCLPKQWESMEFKLCYNNDVYNIKVTQNDYEIVKI